MSPKLMIMPDGMILNHGCSIVVVKIRKAGIAGLSDECTKSFTVM
jgi:hypothetical protein